MNIKYIVAGSAMSCGMVLHTLSALADDGQYVTSLSGYSQQRTYFSAQQGADYILYAYGNGTVSIINPTSGPSPVLNPANYNELEAQFRAIYTASYGLDIEPYNYTYGAVYTDCRDDILAIILCASACSGNENPPAASHAKAATSAGVAHMSSAKPSTQVAQSAQASVAAAPKPVIAAVRKLAPHVNIQAVDRTPLPDIWQVIAGGQVVYVSADGRYMCNGDASISIPAPRWRIRTSTSCAATHWRRFSRPTT